MYVEISTAKILITGFYKRNNPIRQRFTKKASRKWHFVIIRFAAEQIVCHVTLALKVAKLHLRINATDSCILRNECHST